MSVSLPLYSDVIPGDCNRSNLISHLIGQGIYTTTSSLALKNFSSIQSCLRNLGMTSSKTKSENKTSINSLIGLSISFAQNNTTSNVRLLILCDRTLPIDIASVNNLSQSLASSHLHSSYICSSKSNSLTPPDLSLGNILACYSQLGRISACYGCYIDIFHVGVRPTFLDRLEIMANTTGGKLTIAQSFENLSFRSSFNNSLMKSFNNNYSNKSYFPLKGSIATLDVRTCDRMSVDRIVGLILPSDDCFAFHSYPTRRDVTNIVNSNDNDHLQSLSIDSLHVADTIELALDAASSSDSPSLEWLKSIGSKKESDKHNDRKKIQRDIYGKLIEYNQNRTVVCGMNRCDVNQMITIQLRPNLSNFNINDLYNNVSNDNFTYLQCIVRYFSNDGRRSICRVWTSRFLITDDCSKYLYGLNIDLWTIMITKCFASDYHYDSIAFYGGAKSIQSLNMINSSNNSNDTISTRDSSLGNLINFMKWISISWMENNGSIHYKSNIILRSLYHFIQGPLLDGPALVKK